MTPKQLQFVNKLLEREGLSFAASSLAQEVSDNRTHKLEDLNHEETQLLIQKFKTPTPSSKMRKKILSMAHEMRWHKNDGIIDYEKLDNWCIKYTPSHTSFKAISNKDLPIVVTIFTKVYKNFLKQL